jgi:hypothetical protein
VYLRSRNFGTCFPGGGELVDVDYLVYRHAWIYLSPSSYFSVPGVCTISVRSLWVLMGKPEGKRPLGRPRRRWEDNIKMDLQEVEGGRGDWMELAQDRDGWRALVITVKNFRAP